MDTQISNAQARANITRRAIKQLVPAASGSLPLTTSGDVNNALLQLTPTPNGVQLGFYIHVVCQFKNTSGETLTRSPFAAANLLQNITYYDVGNQQRSNISGKMLHMFMSQKSARVFGASVSPDDGSAPVYGDWGVNQCPATVAPGASALVSMMYYLPLAYSEVDLRGAVFGNIAMANQRLNLTFANKNVLVSNTTESAVDSVYSSPALNKNIEIEHYAYDVRLNTYGNNLPMAQNGHYIVPLEDLGTVYALTETSVTGLIAGQQAEIPYPNSFEYLSTMGIYVNGLQLNAGHDVMDIEIKTASGTSFGAYSPVFHAFTTLSRLGTGLPAGAYYDSHHQHPIRVAEYGNIKYCVRPKVVNLGASLRIGYEYFDKLSNYSAIGLTM